MTREGRGKTADRGGEREERTVWQRWRRRLLVGVVALLMVLILLVVLLPFYSPFFAPLLAGALERRLGWETSLEDVSVNLLKSTVSLRELHVRQGPHREPLGVGELFVDFELLPLLKGEIRVPELRITRPHFLVERNKTGRLNWSHVLETGKPTPEPSEEKREPVMVTANVLVSGGSVTVVDARSGLSANLSDLDLSARVKGLEDVTYDLTTDVRANTESKRPMSVYFGLGSDGKGSLTAGSENGGLSAEGQITATGITTEGLRGDQVREGAANVSYALSADDTGARIESFRFGSDYLDVEAENLGLGLVQTITSRLRSLPFDGTTSRSTTDHLIQTPKEPEGQLTATVQLDEISRDFGAELASRTGEALEYAGGTVTVRLGTGDTEDGGLWIHQALSIEDLEAAGKWPTNGEEDAELRPYRLAFGRISQSAEVTLDDAGGSLKAELGAGTTNEAGSRSVLDFETAASWGSAVSESTGYAWHLRQKTTMDLSAMLAATGGLLSAAGLVPEDTMVEGVIHDQFELARAGGTLKMTGNGSADSLLLESSLLRPTLDLERLAPGALNWWHDFDVTIKDGLVRAVRFAPGEQKRFGLAHAGAELTVDGNLEKLEGAISECRMDGLDISASLLPSRLPAAIHELLKRRGVTPGPDDKMKIGARVDGTPDAFRAEPRLAYEGRFSIEDVPLPIEESDTPVELDLSLRAVPRLGLQRLASFAAGKGSEGVRLEFLEVPGEAPLQVSSQDGLLAEFRPKGSIVLQNSGLQFADAGGQLRIHPSRLRSGADRWFPGVLPALAERSDLSGVAALEAEVNGRPDTLMQVALDADMDALGMRWSPQASADLVRKEEGIPLSLNVRCSFAPGRDWELIVDRAKAELGGIRATTAFLLEDAGLRGPPPHGSAFLEVEPFDGAQIIELVPALADSGLSEVQVAMSARDIAADFSTPHVRASLEGSVNAPDLDAASLRGAFQRLAAALPGPSAGAGGKAPDEAVESPETSTVAPAVVGNLLRDIAARFRVHVGSLSMEQGRVEDVDGIVLLNGDNLQDAVLLDGVADVHLGDASVGRLKVKCRTETGVFPYNAARCQARVATGPLRGTSVTGWVDGILRGAPSVQSRFDLPRLEIDSELLSVLPARYRELLRPYSVGGTVHGAGFLARPADGKLRYSANLMVNGGRFEAKSPPLALHGLSAVVHADELRVQVPRFTAMAWGGPTEGSLLVNLATQAGTSPRFEYNLQMRGASLAQIGARLGGGAADLEGRIFANMNVAGQIDDPSSLTGRSNVTIEEGRLAELPLIASVFNLFSLGLPEKTVFDLVVLETRFEGGKATFPSILLSSSSLEITGKGEITFEGDCNLVMALATSERPKKGIPLVTDALSMAVRAVQRTVLPPVLVTGKVWEPRVRVMAMRPITRPLESMRGLVPLLPDPQGTGGPDAVGGVRSYGTW